MYYGYPPRIYILTKKESDSGKAICPKCGRKLALLPFTKSDRLYSCKCGFRIQKSCVVLEKKNLKNELLDIISELDKPISIITPIEEGNGMNSIVQGLSKVAKELQAAVLTKDQVLHYMKATEKWPSLSPKLAVEPKDIKRILDINKKTYGGSAKKFQLIQQMAKSIKDPAKAYRRGVATLENIDLDYSGKIKAASIFFEKAVELL